MRVALLAGLLAAGCTKGGDGGPGPTTATSPSPATSPSTSTERVPVVTSPEEARAHLGKVVRVTGTVAREKLGDSVGTGTFDVICLDARFNDEKIGTRVTVEGTIDETDQFQSTRNEKGEITQGTMAGVTLWVMRDCFLVEE